jgi:hypothetical protein
MLLENQPAVPAARPCCVMLTRRHLKRDLMGCNAVYFEESPTFRLNTSPTYSRSKSKPSRGRRQAAQAICSSETSGFSRTTWHYNLEGRITVRTWDPTRRHLYASHIDLMWIDKMCKRNLWFYNNATPIITQLVELSVRVNGVLYYVHKVLLLDRITSPLSPVQYFFWNPF